MSRSLSELVESWYCNGDLPAHSDTVAIEALISGVDEDVIAFQQDDVRQLGEARWADAEVRAAMVSFLRGWAD